MAKPKFQSGASNKMARLQEKDVRAIFEWHGLGLEGRFLAEHFGVSDSAISAIITGRKWKYLNLPVVSFQERRLRSFWRQVDRKDEKECWNWLGCTNRDTKYGRFCWNGKVVSTHVFSYRIHKGEVPRGLEVTHSCDNRRCVNPHHLFAKTRLENVHEMWERERASAPPSTARQPGEGNPMHKLTNAQVLEIRRRRQSGEGVCALAKAFHVHPPAISRIVNNQCWNHLNG